ncbi:uncharacterized protein LOC108908495 [Anoplophora glabripennis]|nr:uncharacterized protein LOC108908495 [Anoplophora glabripennis]
MLLKTLICVVLIQIAITWGYPQKFMIKNKKTGMVLDGAKKDIAIGQWKNRNTQIWTLEGSDTPGHYIVRNIGNQKVLDACPVTRAIFTWSKHGGRNQRWKLNANDDTRIQVEFYPNDFMVHKGNKVKLQGSKEGDDSDIWLLVEPQSVPTV